MRIESFESVVPRAQAERTRVWEANREKGFLRGAVYARYSTTDQSATSIERQVELCREWAERNGVRIVAMFRDDAVSGKAVATRDGLMAMMSEAEDFRFDVVLVEDADRLSRNLGDTANAFAKLQHYDCALASAKRGVLSTKDIAVFGLLSEAQLAQLVDRVRAAMRRRAAMGLWSARAPYGYRYHDTEPGVLGVVEEEAEGIRLAFEVYGRERNLEAVARALQEAGFPPPRGNRVWRGRHVARSDGRATGLLNNPLCVGLLTYGTSREYVAPGTRTRRSKLMPEADWVVTRAPHLAIVDDDVYGTTQLSLGACSDDARRGPPQPHPFPRGLFVCGHCGSGYVVADARRSLACGKWDLQCASGRRSVRIALLARALEDLATQAGAVAPAPADRANSSRNLLGALRAEADSLEGRVAALARAAAAAAGDDDQGPLAAYVEAERRLEAARARLAEAERAAPSRLAAARADASATGRQGFERVEVLISSSGASAELRGLAIGAPSGERVVSRIDLGKTRMLRPRRHAGAFDPLADPAIWGEPLETELWEAVAPILVQSDTRYLAVGRKVLLGVLYKISTRCRWADLPKRYGTPYSSNHATIRLKRRSMWEAVVAARDRVAAEHAARHAPGANGAGRPTVTGSGPEIFTEGGEGAAA